MDNDRLKKAREKILSYTDKKWSLKEEGKKLRFETYKAEIVKRIDSILEMREKIDRYIKDINDYAYQCHQLDPQADFFDRWTPTVKKETLSPIPPLSVAEPGKGIPLENIELERAGEPGQGATTPGQKNDSGTFSGQ